MVVIISEEQERKRSLPAKLAAAGAGPRVALRHPRS